VEEKKEDLIKLRIVEEMVPRQFHKYLRRKSQREYQQERLGIML